MYEPHQQTTTILHLGHFGVHVRTPKSLKYELKYTMQL